MSKKRHQNFEDEIGDMTYEDLFDYSQSPDDASKKTTKPLNDDVLDDFPLPESFEEVKKRAEKHLIQAFYPRSKKTLLALSLIVVTVSAAVYLYQTREVIKSLLPATPGKTPQIGLDVTLHDEKASENAPIANLISGPVDITVEKGGRGNRATHYENPELKVSYDYERIGDKVQIKYQMPYLSLLSKGGPIVGMKASFEKTAPSLSIKVVNNTQDTLFLTNLVVRVKSSSVNEEPVLTVGDDEENKFSFYNMGWGAVLNPEVKFGMADEKRYKAIDPKREPMSYSVTPGDFTDTASVSLEKYIPNTKAPEVSGDYTYVPLFSRKGIYGEIKYGTEDRKERSVSFKTLATIKTYVLVRKTRTETIAIEPIQPLQGVMEATSVYVVPLKAGEQGYTKRIPLKQYVKPNDVDHFALVIESDKSASYDLSFDFITAYGAISHSKNVTLDIFVPR